jgi:hypothetical protein
MATLYLRNHSCLEIDSIEDALCVMQSDQLFTRLEDLIGHVEEAKRILKGSVNPSRLRDYMALSTDLRAVLDCFEQVFGNQCKSVDKQLTLPIRSNRGNSAGKAGKRKAVRIA